MSQFSEIIAREKSNILTKHASLPTTIISDKGSASVSEVIIEVAEFLRVTSELVTTKHAQTFQMIVKTHATQKGSRYWNRWTKVNVAQVCQPCSPKLQYGPWVTHALGENLAQSSTDELRSLY